MALSIFSLMGSIFVDSSEAEQSISKTEEKAGKLSESLMNGIATAGKWGAGIATAAGAAAVAIGSAAINVSNDVDSAMNDFAASTGTAVDELGKYEEAMLNIYNNNFGESFEDIAASMGEVKKIMGEGMGAEALETMTQDALMLRDTFDFEVSESVRAANSLMDQFGLTGEQAYNLIAQGAQNGLNQNGDMLDVINEYSVQFEQMGYSAEDMFNMLANGAESGTWSIDKLGDAAKEFNIRMSDGSAKDAVEALGFSWEAVSESWSAGGEDAKQVMNMLLNELDGLEDTTEGYNIGVGLMGTMFEDMGHEALLALSDTEGAISNTKDALSEINEIKYDDLGSMIEGLKRNFETMLLPIGEALMPVIMQLMQLIQDNMPIIEGMIAQITPIISELFASLIPPLIELVATFLPQISEIINAVLPSLISLLGSLMPVFIEIIEAVMPVLVELLNTLLPPIMEIVDMILPVLLELISPLLALLQPIIDLLNPIIQLCMALIVPLMELLGAVLPPLNEIIMYLVNVVLFALQTTFQTVADVISNVINVAVTYVTNQISILQSIFTNIIDFIKNVFTGNWRGAWENVKTIVSDIFQGMINAVKTPVNAIIGIINGMISGVTSGINAVINALNKLEIDVPDWVTETLGISSFGFNIANVSAPQIPLLASGGTAIEGGSAIVGEAGAELIDLPAGATVKPLTNNGDPIGYKAFASKLDTMIALLSAILEKEGVVRIGEKEFMNYVNRSLGAML